MTFNSVFAWLASAVMIGSARGVSVPLGKGWGTWQANQKQIEEFLHDQLKLIPLRLREFSRSNLAA